MTQSQPQDRPPYVTFKVRPRETRDKDGLPAFVDEHIAYITRPGQRDTVEREAVSWLSELDRQVIAERFPQHWATQFRSAYEAWKKGQELPESGTPIKGWALVSPAVQETILYHGVRTVEDLAALSDEAARRLGMGAISWKAMAATWVAQNSDKAGVAARQATLERDNADLQAKVAEQAKLLEQALAKLESLAPKTPVKAF